VPGRVLGAEGGEGGERLGESGRGWIGVRGGAGNSEGGQAPCVSLVGNNGEEASLPGQDGCGGGEEVVCGPSLDPVPEAVHSSEHSVVWGEAVSSVGEYREAEGVGNPMAEEWFDAGSCRGEAFNKGEEGLGQ